MTVKRAIVSVHRKDGVVDLARGLVARGFEVVSTGGTAKALREASVPVRGVSEVTGFPEILDGRVKTLHPAIHGGILARAEEPGHAAELERHGIPPVTVVAVNLYPFEETVARGATLAQAVENIDIGGPTMLRASAKNFRNVCVVVDPADYPLLLEQLDRPGGPDAATRLYFAQKAFRHTAHYEAAIAAYFGRLESHEADVAPARAEDEAFPYRLSLTFEKVQDLRYGENPHQRAAFYSDLGSTLRSVAAARKVQGKELSFNNILDLDAAWRLVTDLDPTACVIVKHTNPCGTAVGASLAEAWARAKECDPVSAFGGIVAFNRRLDAEAARAMADLFLEVVIAPGYEPDARDVLAAKKNLRVMDMDHTAVQRVGGRDMRRVMGGLLVQDWDLTVEDVSRCDVVSKRHPGADELAALQLAWTVCKHVKSNAIVYATSVQTVGVGAGQMSRVDSARIAAEKARLPLKGTAAASDAFFPFRDGVDTIAAAGATAIVQPGGSVRDEEVIAAADEHGLAMVFTGVRHFRH
jgi:phosphoribosylaminoimidazolecarboxamide formyltransferase / IMP cyclohydrolase